MTTFAITFRRVVLVPLFQRVFARENARLLMPALIAVCAVALSLLPAESEAETADISRFFGHYEGAAKVEQLDGSLQKRDLSVWIKEVDEGFLVEWHTAIERPDGKRKTKTYRIEFQPSERQDVYAAAMTRNVFGHTVQMNPMKGEPFVWARVIGKTLTVFSLYVAENGDYLMQQYDRTLADEGLLLTFSLHRNGLPSHSVETMLQRVE